MKLEEFIKLVGNLPVIDTEVLLTGVSDYRAIKVQISRWEKSGKLIQLKRGIYLLTETYRKTDIYEPYIAAILKKPSYISLEKALEYHGLIPEAVSIYTSVTPKWHAKFSSPVGVFSYRHIKKSLFWGYASVAKDNQIAFIATPEKALLDLFYLNGLNISQGYLKELRLQNVSNINTDKLLEYAGRFKKPGILRAAKVVNKYIQSYQDERKVL